MFVGVTDSSVLPHGPNVALDGLRKSHERLHHAIDQVLRGGGGGPVWIALSEALYWIAALDDHFAGDDYWSERISTEGGRSVGGLVYARNMHAHELVSAGEAQFTIGSSSVQTYPPGEAPQPGRGTVFSTQLLWVGLNSLPAPERREKHGRDQMYADRVGRRPLSHPVNDAIAWFDRVIASQRYG